MRSESSRFVFIKVVLDSVNGDSVKGAWEDELLHILTGGEETNCWCIGSGDTDEFGEALLDTFLGTGTNKNDLAIKLFSSLLVNLVVSTSLVIGEKDKSILSFTEDWFNVVLRESDQHGDAGSFHPLVKSSEDVLAIVVDW